MAERVDRREFIRQTIFVGMGASALIMGKSDAGEGKTAYRAQKSGKPFEGIFPIMQTPFRDDGEIDTDVLLKEAAFIIEAGGHGMVWPQLGSEFYVLTDEERLKHSALLVREVKGRLPVIIGVQSTNYWKSALQFAKQAEEIGADGIISLPPFTGNATVDFAAEYFALLAKTTVLPVFIQNSGGSYGPAMPTDRMIELAKEYPNLAYVKEEASPVTHRIGALAEKGKGFIKGVFSGASGVTLLNELRRGCKGTMPGAALVDVFAKIYESFVAGEEEKAQEIFNKMMSFQMFARGFWMGVEKEVLRRRGIFNNTRMRIAPYELKWDKVDEEEFEVLLNNLKPYFAV